MNRTIKAAVLHGIEDLRIEDVPMPAVERDDDVLVKVDSVGVCGSDVHYYRHGRIGDWVVKSPLILGHECAGIVEEVGAGVKGLRPGDRVALEPGVPCGRCRFCRSGRYNLCPDVEFMGTPPVNGAFTEYVVHPASFTYPLPDNVSLAEGAMLEPFSVGMHACATGGVQPGHTVAVLGSGPIGLVILQAARAYGASLAVAVDIVDFRLDMARKLGATHTVNAGDTDPVEAISEITGGDGADVVFEAAGAEQTARQTVDMVRRAGTIVMVGMGTAREVPINIFRMMAGEVQLKPIRRYANTYGPAIRMVAAGAVDLRSMITGEYPFDRVEEALTLGQREPETTIKTMVKVTQT